MSTADHGSNADTKVSSPGELLLPDPAAALAAADVWPVPFGAVEILPADASRIDYAGWQAARLAGIGGSDVPAIVGAVKWESRYGLWLTKTGRRPPIDDNGIMERGRYLEPALAQFFADKTGIACRKTGTWARLEYVPETGQTVPGWMRCNPDRFTADGGIAEIKAPNHADWGELWYRGPALHAVVQLMWCFEVCDLRHGYVIADGPDGLRWWRVERDPEIGGWLVERATRFYFDHVAEDLPPDVDGSEATTLAIKSSSLPPEQLAKRIQVPGCLEWARRRGELKRSIAAGKKELDRIENLFKAHLTGAVTAYDGPHPVLSWRYVALDSAKPYRKLEEPK